MLQCDFEQVISHFELPEQIKGLLSSSTGKTLDCLIKQSGRRDGAQQRGQRVDGCLRFLLDAKIKLGCQSYCSQHAHRVFPVAGFRVSNHTNQARLNIRKPINEVQYEETVGGVIQCVNCEVAACSIFIDRPVYVIAQNHAGRGVRRVQVAYASPRLILSDFVFNVMVRTESGYLDHFTAEADVSNLESATDHTCLAKQVPGLFRGGISGYVEVLWAPTEQE